MRGDTVQKVGVNHKYCCNQDRKQGSRQQSMALHKRLEVSSPQHADFDRTKFKSRNPTAPLSTTSNPASFSSAVRSWRLTCPCPRGILETMPWLWSVPSKSI